MTSAAPLSELVMEKTLANGLKVILLENHKAPVVTFQVWYRVGSRNEEWGRTGLSHLLEHMMFKGTKKVSGQEFTRIVAENGGNENAFTSQDYTAYFENIASDRINVVVGLEADRMHNLVLTEKDFTTERMVVLEERRMRTEDDPQAYLAELTQATVFQTSPYHWPVIGWEQDLRNLEPKDLKSYYAKYYNPANAFIVVVGDFQKKKLLPVIEKAFNTIPKGKAPHQKKDIDAPQTGMRRVEATREAQLPYVLFAHHVPNLADADSYVLEVIAEVLSGGKSSRLYRSLVQEKQLAIRVDADNPQLSRDPGMFTVSAQVAPGKEPRAVEEAMSGEIARLCTEELGERELEKAKNGIEASFVYAQQSFFSQAMYLARFEIAESWKKIDDYLALTRKVTAADVQRVANLYLIPRNRTVGTLVPVPPKPGRPVKSEPPPGQKQIVR
jgi:zinc protease